MPESAPLRVFLVVVDETPEHRIAVRYAARRAAHTGGRLALLYVIEPTELQHFLAIEELARAERREAAEELLQGLCDSIAPVAGAMPSVYIREGRRRAVVPTHEQRFAGIFRRTQKVFREAIHIFVGGAALTVNFVLRGAQHG